MVVNYYPDARCHVHNPLARTSRHGQRGIALVSAMIAVVVLATLSLALSMMSISNNNMLTNSEDRMQALLLAQSGLNMAIKRYSTLPDGNRVLVMNFGPNQVIRVDKQTTGAGIRLVSYGAIVNRNGAGNRSDNLDLDGDLNVTELVAYRRMEAVLVPTSSQGSFRSGAFGDALLDAHGNITTDAYNSDGVPIMKRDPGVDGIVGNADDPLDRYAGPDGILNTADDYTYPKYIPETTAAAGPDGVLGTVDDVQTPRFTAANYNQQIKSAARIYGDPAAGIAPRPNTLADPITAAELGTSGYAYTAAELAAFRETTLGGNGDVGSNAGVSAVGALVIYGDATPGPGQTVTGGGLVTGSTAAATTPWTLDIPVYSAPAGLPVSTLGATLGATGTTTIQRLTSWPSTDLTVQGDVTIYLEGDFLQNGTKAITLAPNAKLTIYQSTGTFTLNGGGIVNGSSKKPADFTLVSSSTSTVKLAGGAEFYGTVYAPKAPVVVIGNADSFGAFVGATVDLGGTADFHYDMAAKSPGIITTVSVAAYRELD
jgi:hypothetical protein